ncbi:MAG TPA: HD domain-containing protein [Nitrososphaerales archaeon]|nr:HD domain-containing protein [Nitrososphaerales archaeon]
MSVSTTRKDIGKTPSITELILAAGKLKTTKRTGWYRKVGIEECESVADHSYRTALIACALSEEMGLDSGKVARMCLLHDLAESQIGDLMPEEKNSFADHRESEDRAMRSILGTLPNRVKKRFLSDWKELLANKTSEARLSWQVDKMEMGLQSIEYVALGYDKVRLSEFSRGRELPKKMQRILGSYMPQRNLNKKS